MNGLMNVLMNGLMNVLMNSLIKIEKSPVLAGKHKPVLFLKPLLKYCRWKVASRFSMHYFALKCCTSFLNKGLKIRF
jgi:hypothetical protein